jgi:hypothetical protein
MIRWLVLGLFLTAPAWAQQGSMLEPELDLNFEPEAEFEESVEQDKVVTAPGAMLRGLDKVSGALTDLEMTTGQTQRMGRLEVTLGECRFPEGNPAGDAYAFLVIRTAGDEVPVFQGWMIASSPALNALDHPRYDVWVLRCMTS